MRNGAGGIDVYLWISTRIIHKNRGFVKKSKEVISEADCQRYIDGADVWSDIGIRQRVYRLDGYAVIKFSDEPPRE